MDLRKGLVEKYYKKIGIDITVDELITTVAGSESVNLALEIACNPGDEVLVLERPHSQGRSQGISWPYNLKDTRNKIRELLVINQAAP